MSKDLSYITEEDLNDENKYRFFFKSINDLTEKEVIKTIEYLHFEIYENRKVFNLGFGDYDETTDKIIDDQETNNGDVYRIFNTVLNTVPVFFEKCPDGILFITGSDSKDQFAEKCKESCKKGCKLVCKNQHRRIKTYCNYIRKNYIKLSKEYDFYGGKKNNLTKKTSVTLYDKNVKYYDIVLVSKKN